MRDVPSACMKLYLEVLLVEEECGTSGKGSSVVDSTHSCDDFMLLAKFELFLKCSSLAAFQ